MLFQILCVVPEYEIQNTLLRQLSGKSLVLVPTLTMPVKHNCQYDDVVGECNVSLAIVCKVIVPVLFWSTIFNFYLPYQFFLPLFMLLTLSVFFTWPCTIHKELTLWVQIWTSVDSFHCVTITVKPILVCQTQLCV